MPDDIALAVEGVGHHFGAATVLKDCTLGVPAGAVAALVGRNGAGKSTLLRAAAGVLRPYRGTVRVFGRPAGPDVLRRIGFVAQHAPLFRTLTVAETLRLGARLNPRWDAAHARRLADAAALPDRARVGALSTGQRTRLALALALGKRPDLLILDEPLAGLDPVARAEVTGALMGEVAERGVTVLLSAHVVADVESVCDHVVVLAGGRAVLSAPVEAALDAHRLAVGPARDAAALAGHDVVELRRDGAEFTALVRAAGPPPGGTAVAWHRPTLEELLLAHLRADRPQPAPEVSAA
ncbi:ABC transporter ATP-binding protein [Spirilliplanes yamanashiensis]|uniref:ABC transporter ATP-binding protein n=1 Tax=Spirilliplanes yamanashiensis TaxID=42233 RepID=A0A8J3YBP1_9ACTN|nr:ATP-binding cassette domain-containing protein [Spirilliplanes yamanashiensis]MDP9817954.1 ABC-2 type transport system ATP-binding protein [Spirilliplanes yamanashiensis]GIJ04763.1 ABC transporter ATP-binding protein [Spirilliplanes yamanashiensis]